MVQFTEKLALVICLFFYLGPTADVHFGYFLFCFVLFLCFFFLNTEAADESVLEINM